MKTPQLLRFVEEGNVNKVSALLSSGSDPNATNKQGQSALYAATKNGNVDLVKLLLKYNANVNQAENNGWTPLIEAAYGGNVEVARLLLPAEADPNISDHNQWTALHFASSNGNEEVVRLLLQYHADVSLNTSDGESPRDLAVRKQRSAIAALLADAASIPSAEASFASELTPALLDAIEANSIPTIVRLIKSKADVNRAGPDGTLPLCLAALLRRQAIAGMLIIAKADGDKVNGCGGTALTIAASNGDETIVEMLIQDGVNVNSTDSGLNTPLLLAVKHGHSRIVQRLLNARADVTKRNSAGETALIVAMKFFRRGEAKLLHASVAKEPVKIDPAAIQVVRKLGSGGFNFIVEKATYCGKEIAVKSALHRQDTPDLLAEAAALTSSNSPYVISLIGKTDEADRSKLVVNYMDQGNLREHLNDKLSGSSTAHTFTTAHVAWVVANALLDLHEKSLVHRDLKSEHILLSATKHIKVAHLGGTRTRVMDMPMAALLWTAPEILLGEPASAATDVYAFGVILTELDTLQRPYWDLSLDPWALTDSIRKGVIRPSLSSTSPAWFKELVDRCLAFNASERPSAKAIVEILETQWRDQVLPVHVVRFPSPNDTAVTTTTSAGFNDVE